MKTYESSKSDLVEIILPVGGEPGGELFDDCPLCQELKRALEEGELKSVPIQVEVEGGC